jgi:golgi phosphoprotein 3
MTMTTTISTREASTVLALQGRLDTVSSPGLEAQAAELASAGTTRVVLDCAGLAYASSAGIRAIIVAARALSAAGGGLAIARVSDAVAPVFTISGIGNVLPVTATVEDAEQALAARVRRPESPSPSQAPAEAEGLTLVEELVLLAIDEQTGRVDVDARIAFDCALAGAALAELAFMGRLDADAEQFVVVDPTPTGHPLLDPVLASVAAQATHQQVRSWINGVGSTSRDLLNRTLARLTEQGILQQEQTTRLWVFKSRRYRTLDGRERDDVRSRLTALVLGDDVPDPRDSVLIGLVMTAKLTDRAFTDPRARDRHDRIEALAQLDLVGTDLARSVDRLLESLALAMALAH